MAGLVTADVHIDAYRPYAELNEKGVPDRLLHFHRLADRLVSICRKNKLEWIVIAGDLANSATNSPMVNNAIDRFLRKLSKAAMVYLIHGNHDYDSLSYDEDEEQRSLLWRYRSFPRVRYLVDEEETVGNCKVYFRGWRDSFEVRETDAEVLVTHGAVSGMKLPVSGYTLEHGFDPKELSKRFRFSLIGDIHKGKLWYGNVLVPGCPMQCSFKDDPNTGVWIVDDDWKTVKFVAIRDPEFHRFLTARSEKERESIVSEEEGISEGRLHVNLKERAAKSSPTDEDDSQEVLPEKLDDFIASAMAAKKIEDPSGKVAETVRSLLSSQESSASGYAHRRLRLSRLEIRNFRSVKHLDLSFSKARSPMLLVGESGSGKSSILEAVCFALWGVSTSGAPLRDLKRDLGSEEAEVRLHLTGGPQEVVLVRSQSARSLKVGDSVSHPTAVEWNKQVASIISMTRSEFLDLVYYGQDSGSLVGALTASTQASLFSSILGLSLFDSAYETSTRHLSETKERLFAAEGALQALQGRKGDRDRLRELEKSLKPHGVHATMDAWMKKEFPATFKTGGLDALRSRHKERVKRLGGLEQELSHLRGRSTDDSPHTSKCPTCGQKMPTRKVKSDPKEQRRLQRRIEELEGYAADLNRRLDKSDHVEEKIESAWRAFSGIQETVRELRELEKESDGSIQEAKKEVSRLTRKVERWKAVREILSPSGIYPFLFRSLTARLNEEAAALLLDTGIKVEISPVRYTQSGKPTSGLDIQASFFGAPMRKYPMLSVGQQRFCDLVLVLLLNNFLLSRKTLGLLMLDELFVHLGDNILDVATQLLQHSKAPLILSVSHDYKVRKAFETCLLVRLSEKKGTVLEEQNGNRQETNREGAKGSGRGSRVLRGKARSA